MREILNISEAAKRLGISARMVYRLFDRGELEGYTVGRKRIVFEDSITEYQERHRNQKPAKSSAKIITWKHLT